MNQCDRIKLIIKENNLKQKEFASSVEISESYISKLVKDPHINISNSLLELIKEKYGYNPNWIVYGKEPKLLTKSKSDSLSDRHKKLISELERMPEEDLLAIEAFMDSLNSIKSTLN